MENLAEGNMVNVNRNNFEGTFTIVCIKGEKVWVKGFKGRIDMVHISEVNKKNFVII